MEPHHRHHVQILWKRILKHCHWTKCWHLSPVITDQVSLFLFAGVFRLIVSVLFTCCQNLFLVVCVNTAHMMEDKTGTQASVERRSISMMKGDKHESVVGWMFRNKLLNSDDLRRSLTQHMNVIPVEPKQLLNAKKSFDCCQITEKWPLSEVIYCLMVTRLHCTDK